YSPRPETSLGAQARSRGVDPRALALDILLERDGGGVIYYPTSNYREKNLNAVHEMITHPHTFLGVADGGAHMNYICDSSAPSYLLTHWTRDAMDNPRVPLPTAINWLTRKPALFMGLDDRGLVAPGYKADLNVIDYDALRLHPPHIVNDLPA